jgi:hypothetical protein
MQTMGYTATGFQADCDIKNQQLTFCAVGDHCKMALPSIPLAISMWPGTLTKEFGLFAEHPAPYAMLWFRRIWKSCHIICLQDQLHYGACTISESLDHLSLCWTKDSKMATVYQSGR